MSDELSRIDTVIEYVVEFYVDDASPKPIRLTLGDDMSRAVRVFESLRPAYPVHATGEQREGWMNLIAVTARSPEPAGTLIDQCRWDR